MEYLEADSFFNGDARLRWLVLLLQDGNSWINSHVPTFSAIDPSYSLPNNIAVITLQVCGETPFTYYLDKRKYWAHPVYTWQFTRTVVKLQVDAMHTGAKSM